MSVSARLWLVLAIVAPTVMLVIAAAAVRICRLLFKGQQVEHSSRTSSGDHLRSSRSVFPASLSTLERGPGVGHHHQSVRNP
jgi:hypothetical protein